MYKSHLKKKSQGKSDYDDSEEEEDDEEGSSMIALHRLHDDREVVAAATSEVAGAEGLPEPIPEEVGDYE